MQTRSFHARAFGARGSCLARDSQASHMHGVASILSKVSKRAIAGTQKSTIDFIGEDEIIQNRGESRVHLSLTSHLELSESDKILIGLPALSKIQAAACFRIGIRKFKLELKNSILAKNMVCCSFI